jgi:glycosyltransferase involved in cell wall biosynthesis
MNEIKPLKILHVISDMRRGGRERQLATLVDNSNSVLENHILAFHNVSNNYLNEYSFSNFNYTGKLKIKRFLDITSYVRKCKINLIHTWGNSETLYSFPAAKFCGIPLLNGSIRHGIRRNNFSHRFRSIVLQFSKYILANSYAGFEANKIKINNKRHFVIYNGIEEKFFTDFNIVERNDFNKTYNLTVESIVFISIANFIPYKDYFTILNVLAGLKKKGLSFHYIMIGTGPLLKQINDFVEKIGLKKNISVYSNNPDIPSLLSISDIMIHSSLGEGCANAILEGSASGLMVVASDTGGTKEIIYDKDLLFSYKDEQDLDQKIELALLKYKTDKNLRQKISEETKKRFSVNSFIKNYYDCVNTIIN